MMTGRGFTSAILVDFGRHRRHAVDRTTLEREFVEVDTGHGNVKIKVSKLDGEVVTSAPEYEDCARIAREKGVPLKQIQARAMKSYLSRAKEE